MVLTCVNPRFTRPKPRDISGFYLVYTLGLDARNRLTSLCFILCIPVVYKRWPIFTVLVLVGKTNTTWFSDRPWRSPHLVVSNLAVDLVVFQTVWSFPPGLKLSAQVVASFNILWLKQ